MGREPLRQAPGASPPVEVNWEQLGSQARVYLEAGAWESAHDLLWPPLGAYAADEDAAWVELPAAAVECLCLLLSACWRLGHSQHHSNGCAALETLTASESCLHPEARVLRTFCLAQRQTALGNHQAAQELLSGIKDEDLASHWTRARLALLRSGNCLRRGDVAGAEQQALLAVHEAGRTDCEGTKADGLGLLAVVAKTRGKYAEATALYARSAAACWQAGNMTGHAVNLLNRAILVTQMGLVAEGHRLCSEALDLSQSLGRPGTEVRARLALGLAQIRCGKLSAARQTLLRGWRRSRRLEFRREEGIALEYLAETYTLRGQLTKARTALRLGARMDVPTDSDVAIELSVRQALLTLAEGQALQAARLARHAAVHAHKIGLSWEEAQALRVLAVAELEACRKESARKSFRRAHAILMRMDDQLERKVVGAWIQALDSPTRGGYPTEISRPAQTYAQDQTPSEQDRALDFWMNHPLLGPNPWKQRSLERRRKRSAAERVGTIKGGKATLQPLILGHRSWIQDAGRQSRANPSQLDTASFVWAELGLVTCTPALLDALQTAETYAAAPLPILILGDTGTGKDLLAQGLHRLSGLTGRYVPVNCAAARKELFVAELFGTRKGAYTGAGEDRQGLIEEAAGGTLFFDEIADLDGEAQGYLLRFLDSGEIRPLGDTKSRIVTTRVLAATCRDLQQLVDEGRFRADLYGRLAGLLVRIPPLSERTADFEALTAMLWRRGGGDPDAAEEVFTPQVIDALRCRRWPGNVRELKHAIDRSLVFHHQRGAAAVRADLLRLAAEAPAESSAQQGAEDPGPGPAGPNRSGPNRPGPNRPGPNRPHADPSRQHPLGSRPDPNRPRPHPPSPATARAFSTLDVTQGEWDPDLLREALDRAGGAVADAARLLGLSRAHAYRLYRRLRAQDGVDGDGRE